MPSAEQRATGWPLKRAGSPVSCGCITVDGVACVQARQGEEAACWAKQGPCLSPGSPCAAIRGQFSLVPSPPPRF